VSSPAGPNFVPLLAEPALPPAAPAPAPETASVPAIEVGGANWAAIASLVETCKLNGVEPQSYFTDLLTRLVNGWPQARIDELMPWH